MNVLPPRAQRAAIRAGPAPGPPTGRRAAPAGGGEGRTPAPGMWRGGFPPRAAGRRAPPPAIEFPEESPEPRFDGKRGGRGPPCPLRQRARRGPRLPPAAGRDGRRAEAPPSPWEAPPRGLQQPAGPGQRGRPPPAVRPRPLRLAAFRVRLHKLITVVFLIGALRLSRAVPRRAGSRRSCGGPRVAMAVRWTGGPRGDPEG